MAEIHNQLRLFGAEELTRAARAIPDAAERKRELARIEVAQTVMGEFSEEDLAFSHSGLCQTCLPHARPSSNDDIWQRQSGRFHLMVTPGVVLRDGRAVRVGVPYGTRARLIMIFLQTEGVKSRTVRLGQSMSAWMRSLGLSVTGGAKGSIGAIREQALRIARCEFTLQWSGPMGEGGDQTIIKDQRLVSGLAFWQGQENGQSEAWATTLELTREFHEHLRAHAVPLDKRAIASLRTNALGLDLYTLFAYRLRRLQKPLVLRWAHLAGQLGSVGKEAKLAFNIREVLPDVLNVYPDARVEATPLGLKMLPSPPPMPKTMVSGYRLVDAGKEPDEGGVAEVQPPRRA
jgi:hypothetical protein